jgi:putative oxidoreductase
MSKPSFLAERVYALLRIVSGFLLALHGLQKVFGMLGGTKQELGSQLWIGGVLELVLGAAICVGFATSLAAFLASGMMAVAYFQFHWKLQFDDQFFPVVNGGELAVVFCFLFLYVAAKGAGPWSMRLKKRGEQ